ncbi:porin [Pseudomonadota bacterium]
MKKLGLLVLSSFMVIPLTNAGAYTLPDRAGFTKTPVVTVGGFVDFYGGSASQTGVYDSENLPDDDKDDTNTVGTQNKNGDSMNFSNESEIHIEVNGINDLGMKYGAIVELEANITNDSESNDINADKAYIFSESMYGKLEFGNTNGVAHNMKLGAETFARGAGGINGEYLNHINLPMVVHQSYSNSGSANYIDDYNAVSRPPRFILIPQHPLDHGGYAKGFYDDITDADIINYCEQQDHANADTGAIDNSIELKCYNDQKTKRNLEFGDNEDATKVSYYTPRIGGLQLGVSYTPDSGDIGTAAHNTSNTSGNVENVIDWGLSYSDTIGNVGLAISVTGQQGDFEEAMSGANTRENLDSIEYGANLSYFGLIFGGSYGEWRNSLYEKKDATGDYDTLYNGVKKPGDASYYTAGLAYEFGPFAISGTYFTSEFQENEYEAYSIGVDYKAAVGFMPYAEVTTYKFTSLQPTSDKSLAEDRQRLRDNKGSVGMIGVLMSF